MNSHEINNLIYSDFEEYSDDSDDDPTWELSDNMNLSSKCLHIIIHNSQFFFFLLYIFSFYITYITREFKQIVAYFLEIVTTVVINNYNT